MKIAFYGSSLCLVLERRGHLLSRPPLPACERGHQITFYEPDAFDRQKHRDIDPPDWCRVKVYPATDEAVRAVIGEARSPTSS
jgi:hypothetical protein